MRRGVEDTAAFEKGINNEVTAEGLVRCFRLLCQEGFVRAETREQMIEVLSAQEFNGMIPASLPKEARVAHKTGEISTVCHDAGIVFLPKRKPYVVAILTEWPAQIERRQWCVAEISRAVYECVTGKEAA
jgi:beta-lactamase class A